MARIVDFFDGAQSETTPTIGNIVASALVKYPDDATYEANEQFSPQTGNLYYNETLNVIRYYNGTIWISIVDESTAQTLTNKSMDGDLNTFTDISLPSLKTVLVDANKFIVRNGLGQVISLKTVPSGEVVGTTDTQTLTNKTIDADQNTITNIENADIKSGAAIDATKLADGSVSNTELQYINSLTSNAQDQLDSKIPLSQKGAANGVATLDATGRVPANQLTEIAMELQGFFNPNTTTLVDGTGSIGDVWEANTAGSHDFGNGVITFAVNDWAVYAADGKWHKSINSNQVTSVNGQIGTVILNLDDINNVAAPTPSAGDFLKYNGTNWVNQAGVASALDDLSDVTITAPVAGQKIQYNGTQWVNVTDNLNSLTDVDTVTNPPVATNVLKYDGTNWVPGSSSGQGDVNFITNFDFEVDTAGYSLYKDLVQSRPVDGTGGTPSGGLTIARSTSAPLNKTASLLVSKNNTNCQGEGFSYDFPIDSMYKGKVVSIELESILSSGTFTVGTATQDSDLIVYIYDVTNGQLIEPSSIKFLSNSSTISNTFKASFQTSASGTNYRLIFHVATTSTATWVLKLDEIKVSPSKYTYGSPISDEFSWTPTFTGLGTVSVAHMKWSRIGPYLRGQGRFTAGTPTAVTASMTLPNGYVSSIATSSHVGSLVNQTGTSLYASDVLASNGSNLLQFGVAGGGLSAQLGTTISGAGQLFSIEFLVPIQGWSSSVQISDQTDTRVVSAILNNGTATLGAAFSDVTFSVVKDTHGTFSSTTYTVPVAGFYRLEVEGRFSSSGAIAATNAIGFQFLVNGSSVKDGTDAFLSTTAQWSRLFHEVELKSGDTIKVQARNQNASPIFSISPTFNIQRISGPSAIAASEKIAARYSTTAGQSIVTSTATIIDFGTKTFDTHSSVTTGGSWKFTAPANGIYRISNNWSYAQTTYSATSSSYASVYKNGTIYARLGFHRTEVGGANGNPAGSGSTTIQLNAGDFIDVRQFQDHGSTKNLDTVSTTNYIDIERIG